jgi:hypothetical protein
MLLRGAGRARADAAIHYVAPVGEKDVYVERAMRVVSPFVPVAVPA